MFDAISLDNSWVNSAPGAEFAHYGSNMIPTNGTWSENDSSIEGEPDGQTIENEVVGNDAFYSFSTLGASTMTVYTAQ